jgi:hypothetical protein
MPVQHSADTMAARMKQSFKQLRASRFEALHSLQWFTRQVLFSEHKEAFEVTIVGGLTGGVIDASHEMTDQRVIVQSFAAITNTQKRMEETANDHNRWKQDLPGTPVYSTVGLGLFRLNSRWQEVLGGTPVMQ